MTGGGPIYSLLGYSMSRTLTISAAATVNAVLVTKVISGVVVDPDGQSVSGANIGTSMGGWNTGAGVPDAGADAWHPWLQSANTTTDGTGKFKLTIMPGAGTLNITPPTSSGMSTYSLSTQATEDKQVGVSIQFLTQTKQATVPAGGTLSTDPGTGPTPSDPVTTTVVSPTGGDVSITEGPIDQVAPTGFIFLTQQIDITAPAATAAAPIELTLKLDGSRLRPGQSPYSVHITRNGLVVDVCASNSGMANPDPCESHREMTSTNGLSITILTSHASAWNFALADSGAGSGTGGATGGGAGGTLGGGGPGAGGSGGSIGAGQGGMGGVLGGIGGQTSTPVIDGAVSGLGGEGGVPGNGGASSTPGLAQVVPWSRRADWVAAPDRRA